MGERLQIDVSNDALEAARRDALIAFPHKIGTQFRAPHKNRRGDPCEHPLVVKSVSAEARIEGDMGPPTTWISVEGWARCEDERGCQGSALIYDFQGKLELKGKGATPQ